MSDSLLQSDFNAIGFHYILQDQSKAHKFRQTTSCICHLNPPGGRRALPQTDCSGSVEWRHQQKLLAVSPGYFQWE